MLLMTKDRNWNNNLDTDAQKKKSMVKSFSGHNGGYITSKTETRQNTQAVQWDQNVNIKRKNETKLPAAQQEQTMLNNHSTHRG